MRLATVKLICVVRLEVAETASRKTPQVKRRAATVVLMLVPVMAVKPANPIKRVLPQGFVSPRDYLRLTKLARVMPSVPAANAASVGSLARPKNVFVVLCATPLRRRAVEKQRFALNWRVA
jgi:hypothetical protein